MDVKEVTFNDMPQIIGKIFQKIERVEQILNNIQEEIEEKKDSSLSAEHIPMTLDEACEFLRMKKSTMYYHLGKEISLVPRKVRTIFYIKTNS